MGALEGAQPVTVYLQSLLPGTIYHFRLVASNAGGTVDGPDMMFTTEEYPASIVQQAPLIKTVSLAPKATRKSLTVAQKLASALKACEKQPRKRRAGCESRARKKYGVKTGKKK